MFSWMPVLARAQDASTGNACREGATGLGVLDLVAALRASNITNALTHPGVNRDLWAGTHFFLDLDLPVRLFFDRALFLLVFPAVLPSLATAGAAALLPAK